jgi:hypothetical protein
VWISEERAAAPWLVRSVAMRMILPPESPPVPAKCPHD